MGENRASVPCYPDPIFYVKSLLPQANTYPSPPKATDIMRNLRVAPKGAQPTPTQITMFHPLVVLMESSLLAFF